MSDRHLWQEILRPQTNIITLRPYSKEELKTRPNLFVMNTLEEVLGGPCASEDVLLGIASTLKTETLLAILSSVNATLLVPTDTLAAVHARLENDLLTAPLRRNLEQIRARDRTPDMYAVFTRRALLLLTKFALGVRKTEQRADFDVRITGDLALAANELLDRQTAADDDAVMLESLAGWDLYNSHNMAGDIARFDFLISDLFSDDPSIAGRRAEFGFGDRPFDGLTFEQYRALVFLTFTVIEKAVRKRDAPVLVLEAPLPAYLGDDEAIRQALDLRSWTLDNFRDPTFGHDWDPERSRELLASARFANDHTWIRTRPFVRLERDRYLLPDYKIAVDRMTSGLFWTLLNGLPAGRIHENFFSLWGTVFERYVIKLLTYFYPESIALAKILHTNVAFVDGSVSGEIDALLDFGDHAIILEIKATPLPLRERATRDIRILDTWIEDRLVRNQSGHKKALPQLVEASMATIRGRVVEGAAGRPVPVVYPVLVSDEVGFEAFGMNRHIAERFEQELGGNLCDAIRPLSIVTTRELEQLLPYLSDGDFSWREVLESRFEARKVKWFSAGQAAYNCLLSKNLAGRPKPNPMLWERFEVFTDALKDAITRSGF